MKKYIIFSDYHIGHPFALKPYFEFKKNSVFLGDNFDIKNSLKTEVIKNRARRNKAMEKCKKAGGIWVSGNHSLEPLSNKAKLFVKRGDILFTHGDFIEWSFGKANFYRTFFSPGKSKLFWNILGYWRKIFPCDTKEINKKQKERAINLAKQKGCKTIVLGHFHTGGKVISITEKGIRIVIVPRGKTIINL